MDVKNAEQKKLVLNREILLLILQKKQNKYMEINMITLKLIM